MIEIRNLTRRFRRGSETVTALDDVSLDILPGELTVAAGPSGSGKTTLLSIIAGYERADAGTATTANGEPTGQLGWADLGFVPQALTLLDELTIAENIDLPDRLDPGTRGGPGSGLPDRLDPGTRGGPGSGRLAPRGDPDRPPVDQLLERLEIEHLANRLPSQVSGGEQQRAAIGRALRLAPAILIGDEPTGHQDRGRVDLVLNILRQHAYAGHVVLISSHDEAVISVADRVITLADGRLVADERSRAGTVPGR